MAEDYKTVHVPKNIAHELRAQLKRRSLPVRGGMTISVENAIRRRMDVLRNASDLNVPSDFRVKSGYNVYILDESLVGEFKELVKKTYGDGEDSAKSALSWEITQAIVDHIKTLDQKVS